nr:putative GH32 family protein [Oppiella nova]
MTSTTTSDAQALMRETALSDELRPAYHFVAPAGWLNDPNGVCQRDGVYHLFYQYNPTGPCHHSIQWGHATSTDLMQWTDRPIALRPSDGHDEEGCWSGVLVDDGTRPVLVYSGHRDDRQTAMLAYGDESLDHWTKEPSNPVIAAPPAGTDITAFRDHCVWREGGVWRQIIGSGIRGRGGAAFLYESDDLVHWRELGPLVVGSADDFSETNPLWTATMWECVDFFRLDADGRTAAPDCSSGDAHVLIFSAWDDGRTMHTISARGHYAGDRFEVTDYHRLDLGGRHAYAPQSFIDEQGRRMLWAWMQEGRDDAAQLRHGWSGAMTLPRVLRLGAAGDVRQTPAPEVEAARGEALEWHGLASRAGAAEFGFEVDLPVGSVVEVDLFATPDPTSTDAEFTTLRLSGVADGSIAVELDRSRSSLDTTNASSAHTGTVVRTDGRVEVRGFLDRSSIELFIDGVPLTTRVYPTRPDADAIRIRAVDTTIEHLCGWMMRNTEQAHRVLDLTETSTG